MWGEIETLRTALIPRLQWAIAESRKQQQPGGAERLSIRVYGVDVALCDASVPFDQEKIPVVKAVSRSRSFSLPIHRRNDPLEGMIGITHVYLFCSGGATLVPFEYRTVNTFLHGTAVGTAIFAQGAGQGATYEEPNELDSFSASPVDAPDGLSEQFRIKANFPAVPPGAVEEDALNLMFRSGQNSCDAIYRLRLHSARQFHDFRFRIAIEHALTISQLAEHYWHRELSPDNTWKAYSTKKGYENYLKRWIVPRWGECALCKIKPIEVELWLRQLPLARSSCAKIKNIMSVLFNHARRYELFDDNPIHLVRQSAKRGRIPHILLVDEIRQLLSAVGPLPRIS